MSEDTEFCRIWTFSRILQAALGIGPALSRLQKDTELKLSEELRFATFVAVRTWERLHQESPHVRPWYDITSQPHISFLLFLPCTIE
jgi:hypothetical protein